MASDYLAQMRSLIMQGKHEEAEALSKTYKPKNKPNYKFCTTGESHVRADLAELNLKRKIQGTT